MASGGRIPGCRERGESPPAGISRAIERRTREEIRLSAGFVTATSSLGSRTAPARQRRMKTSATRLKLDGAVSEVEAVNFLVP